MIITICAILILIVIIGSLFSFVLSLYFFLFSKGKEEQKAKGRNSIRYMIIGIVLTALFLVILPLALKGVNVELKNYSTKTIFERLGTIIEQWFKIGKVVQEAQQENKYRGNPYIDSTPSSESVSSSAYQL